MWWWIRAEQGQSVCPYNLPDNAVVDTQDLHVLILWKQVGSEACNGEHQTQFPTYAYQDDPCSAFGRYMPKGVC